MPGGGLIRSDPSVQVKRVTVSARGDAAGPEAASHEERWHLDAACDGERA